MDEEEERLQRKKVVRWLAIGAGALAMIIAAMLTIGAFSDSQKEQAEKTVVSEADLESAKQFATDFVTEAGTFGLSQEAIDTGNFDYIKSQLASNSGAYGNASFGLSRGERYQQLIPLLDINGEEDVTDYFSAELDQYYPDWTGQITSYSVSDVLLTPGEPYVEGEVTLLPMQVSFTSHMRLFNDESVTASSGEWTEYRAENFGTINIVLSLHSLGTWQVWSIEDFSEAPYVLSTWSEPDWKIAAPNKATMQPVE